MNEYQEREEAQGLTFGTLSIISVGHEEETAKESEKKQLSEKKEKQNREVSQPPSKEKLMKMMC